MTFGDQIKGLAGQRTQKEVALEWLDRRQKAGGRGPGEPATAESHLSRLIRHDDATAVRYYFGSPEDACLLLDVLGVQEALRPAIVEAADLIMRNGGPPVRLVCDLTGLSSSRGEHITLFEAIGDAVVQSRVLSPAVVVVTERQYDVLPRSFDDARGWLEIQRVADAQAGEDRAATLAGEHALVLSSWQFEDPARWLAAELKDRSLILEPADGLARFASDGFLPWPVVRHDLADVVSTPAVAPPAGLLPRGIERRRTMTALREEAAAPSVAPDARARLALARALGITATSTERERIEAELTEATELLGVRPVPADEPELARRLESGRRRTAPGAVLRVGDTLHCINLDRAMPEHPRVVNHCVEPPPAVIARLREAAESLSRPELLADPTLAGLVERLDPEKRDRPEFLHARASLLVTGAVRLPPAARPTVPDPIQALASLLADDPPCAVLRVAHLQTRWTFVVEADAWRAQMEWARPALSEMAEGDAVALGAVPPVTAQEPAVLTRESAFQLVTLRDRSSKDRAICLPSPKGDPPNADQWRDLYDCSVPLHGRDPDGDVRGRVHGFRGLGSVALECQTEPLIAARSLWAEGDTQVAVLWIAMRRGLPEAVCLGERTLLIPLAAGLYATAIVTKDEGAASAELDVSRPATLGFGPSAASDAARWGIDEEIRLELRRGDEDLRATVPVALALVGAGIRAELRFAASPLLS